MWQKKHRHTSPAAVSAGQPSLCCLTGRIRGAPQQQGVFSRTMHDKSASQMNFMVLWLRERGKASFQHIYNYVERAAAGVPSSPASRHGGSGKTNKHRVFCNSCIAA